MHKKVFQFGAVLALALLAAPSRAEEGMWTFDNFPAARMREEMGWAPDQAWLDHAMTATARMPGCSASVVSGRGLVLTNHHCVIACISALSNAQEDHLAGGFMARALAEERRCPNMVVSVLESVADVTARIDAAAADAAGGDFARVRAAEIARIESACSAEAVRCEVVTLYQGGRYGLYTYRRYDDVRLAFAPEQAAAEFGGDQDNFNFPRYCADFALLRLYRNNAPVETPHHLRLRTAPAVEGEIVLSSGNPGVTSRLRTAAELAFERDVSLPWLLTLLAAQRDSLAEYARRGGEEARVASGPLQGVENALKALSGRRGALGDAAGFARVEAREADLRARVGRNRAAQREVGDAWGEIARAVTAYRGFYVEHQLLEAGAAQRSDLFAWARDIVRGAAERDKPDAARLVRYSEARLPGVVNALMAQRVIAPAFEQQMLAQWLSRSRAELGAQGAAALLGEEAPDALAARLSQSRLADRAYRMQIWQGGAAAVAASDDPMIVFVRAWDARARAVCARYVEQVEAPVARAQERIAQARFRAFGEAHYPEATFSPRLSYGRITGWREGERDIAAFTRVDGLYARATAEAPYALTQRWLDARSRLDSEAQFNIASSNDAIGGNSGSPLLDREGRVVGVLFDGNLHSLGGEYVYDGALNRAVSVSAVIIMAALREVYGMDTLADELSAP